MPPGDPLEGKLKASYFTSVARNFSHLTNIPEAYVHFYQPLFGATSLDRY